MVKGLESKLDEKQLRCLASWQSSMPCLMAVFNILVRIGGVGSDVFTPVAKEVKSALLPGVHSPFPQTGGFYELSDIQTIFQTIEVLLNGSTAFKCIGHSSRLYISRLYASFIH
ncbi:hypothetical protein TURU_014733 [Turdus rufiventris]|nr:hypothetical protein TURU_014733 [Turdus rufiventris]